MTFARNCMNVGHNPPRWGQPNYSTYMHNKTTYIHTVTDIIHLDRNILDLPFVLSNWTDLFPFKDVRRCAGAALNRASFPVTRPFPLKFCGFLGWHADGDPMANGLKNGWFMAREVMMACTTSQLWKDSLELMSGAVLMESGCNGWDDGSVEKVRYFVNLGWIQLFNIYFFRVQTTF